MYAVSAAVLDNARSSRLPQGHAPTPGTAAGTDTAGLRAAASARVPRIAIGWAVTYDVLTSRPPSVLSRKIRNDRY